MTKPALDIAFNAAFHTARRRDRDRNWPQAFALLEHAHILGQRQLGRHLLFHAWMLRVDWRDAREVRGQILRLILVPFGHLCGELPMGNTRGSSVGAFAPMPIPDELQA